jgi:hypothetical protein
LVKGNFIELTKLDPDRPLDKLLIGEGAETALAAMQLTELPGIAIAGNDFKDLEPPTAREYILLVDNDADGASRKAAGQLPQRLVGSAVRLAMPDKPEGGQDGFDWNDALINACGDETKLAELARAIVEAPTFESVMTREERREIRLNALAALKLDDPLAYEDQRNQAGEDLGLRVSFLDDEVERRCKVLKERREKTPSPPVNMELLAASARDIIACEDVLTLLAEDARRVIAGEEPYVKLLYLVGTSRLFDKGMHAALKGTSSVGKSELRKRVMKYMPPEAVIEFTSLSDKALLYFPGDFQHKILSMGEAHGQEEFKFQDYMLRELMSEGKLRYPVPMKVGNKIETKIIEKNGPVAFIVTTTRNALNPENETRMLSLECDDSEEQTRRVIEKVAVIEGYGREPAEGDYKRWHDFQRWLEADECRVRVPFSRTLGRLLKTAKSTRLRRDFGQLLRAIKAHALIHREHRERDDDGWIRATVSEDYRPAAKLMADLMATAAEVKLRKQIVETVEAVKTIENRRRDEDRRSASVREAAGEGGVTVREAADKLKIDTTTAWRRLRAAEAAGYVSNLETRKGHPGRYRASNERLEVLGELLPTVRELEDALDNRGVTTPGRARASGRSR